MLSKIEHHVLDPQRLGEAAGAYLDPDTVLLFLLQGPWPLEGDLRDYLGPQDLGDERAAGTTPVAGRWRKARAFTRWILGALRHQDPRALIFRRGPRGKPYLAGETLGFNLSHSKEGLVLAVAQGTTLGVDLEYLRPRSNLDGLIARCFSEEERRDFEGLIGDERRHRFHRGWTLKEAYVKAVAQGLSLGLERVVLNRAQQGFLRLPVGDPGQFQAVHWGLGPAHLGLVYRGPQRRVRLWIDSKGQ